MFVQQRQFNKASCSNFTCLTFLSVAPILNRK